MINKGFFITLEGCEGTGKSTQAKKIYDYIKNKNISVLLTREPGGCEEAELIRNILVKGKVNKWDGISECLLHNAARRIHMKKVISKTLTLLRENRGGAGARTKRGRCSREGACSSKHDIVSRSHCFSLTLKFEPVLELLGSVTCTIDTSI